MVIRTVCTDGGDLGEKQRAAARSLRHKSAAWTGCDLQVEDIGGLAFVKDEENLSEVSLASVVSRSTTWSMLALSKDSSVSVIKAPG